MSDARDELVARVTRGLVEVRARIESAGRDPASVTVVAVTKGFGAEGAAAALDAGVGDLAENYADQLVTAHDALVGRTVTWHFLGALQRNKLARLAGRVDCYQSVSSARDAAAIASRAPAARCYVQVNVAGDPRRSGCARGDEGAVVAAATGLGLRVEGLMCVASADPALAEGQFRWLRSAADALGLPGCSMGMSQDLEAAVRAGSTMVRVGTALLGERASRGSPGVA